MSYSMWSTHWKGSFFISLCFTDMSRELGCVVSHMTDLLLGGYNHPQKQCYCFEVALIFSEDVIASIVLWKNLLKQTDLWDEAQVTRVIRNKDGSWVIKQGQDEKARSWWVVGVWTLICELICIPSGYLIDIASSAVALLRSHHCIYGIHFYEIWRELDNTIWPFGLCLIFQLCGKAYALLPC